MRYVYNEVQYKICANMTKERGDSNHENKNRVEDVCWNSGVEKQNNFNKAV